MALDNAEFISELSITDPPGTDPLNQGDDHIRTTKKAVQQSFPNVGSAVPQTGAQMAQMAIKNEVNTFTQTNLFDARQDISGNLRFLFGVGAQRGPQWRDSGLDETAWDLVANVAADDLSLRRYVAGVQTDSPIVVKHANGFMEFNSGAVDHFNTALRTTPGVSGVPDATLDSGWAMIGGSGTLRWLINHKSNTAGNDIDIQGFDGNGAFQHTAVRIKANTGLTHFRNGAAAGPSMAFISDTDTGLFRVSANVLGFASGGVVRGTLTNAGWRSNIAGSAGAPSYSFNDDADTGMYVILSNQLAFAAGGQRHLRIKTNTVNMDLPTSTSGLTSGDCWISSGFVAIIP